MAKPIPEGFHSITPYLAIKGAAEAIDFYKRAFGATERSRMAAPGGSVVHAEIQIGDSVIMLGEENPQMGAPGPKTLGGSTGGLMIYVEDVDAAFARAVGAGATVQMPVADMFWGDRYGRLVDPFGHLWSIGTHKEDLTPEQIGERAQAWFAKMAAGGQG